MVVIGPSARNASRQAGGTSVRALGASGVTSTCSNDSLGSIQRPGCMPPAPGAGAGSSWPDPASSWREATEAPRSWPEATEALASSWPEAKEALASSWREATKAPMSSVPVAPDERHAGVVGAERALGEAREHLAQAQSAATHGKERRAGDHAACGSKEPQRAHGNVGEEVHHPWSSAGVRCALRARCRGASRVLSPG